VIPIYDYPVATLITSMAIAFVLGWWLGAELRRIDNVEKK
jgi:hypothetical protein